MTTLPEEAVKALDTFSFYAQQWGWQSDQGYNQREIDETKANFDASYAVLEKLLAVSQPSAARELALEALKAAEQFIENGFEFGFIRKPDKGDTALETLPKIKAAIHDLQSTTAEARIPVIDEGFRKGLEAACEVIDAHSEYDRQLCCDGRECGCYGATVHQSMQHYIRALSSPDHTQCCNGLPPQECADVPSRHCDGMRSGPDHADAGKVEGDGSFQGRVKPWMLACFGEEISNDKLERCDRFIEEALELVQAIGYSPDRAHALVDYVFNREIGEPHQEVGGVMVTLAALCLAAGLDMAQAGEDELARIWTKVEKIRAKQAAKPTGSALPIPSAPASECAE
ncbi:hypothetical protein [Brucella sp. BZ]|uniref:hypothetical protein n=1 Tax=Brucella sp. BZ TaxID=3381346 RepID=UPI0039E97DC2